MKLQIAIDGPAGSGKSTVAKRIAHELHLTYLDTGAMYRCATLVSLQKGTKEPSALINFLTENPISFQNTRADQRVFIGLNDVSAAIRTPEVAAAVSEISALPEIRDFMTAEQRRIAADSSIIMDGRDIGTVVLPDADLKIFLSADVHERAERRHKENIEKGIPSALAEIERTIAARDLYDSTRAIAPLKKAPDAIEYDTTGKTIDEVVAFIEEKIKSLS
ncbi:MAG: (d)CMP kinase [Streptococcaceae bacterium]|jgi:cytidylate kinase|nr:(d)CMP kinase [Streptococcaceae bacterium]